MAKEQKTEGKVEAKNSATTLPATTAQSVASSEVKPTETPKAEAKVKKVKAEKKTREAVTAPPAPPVKIGEVENPIIGNNGLKRALSIAIAIACCKGDKLDEKTFDVKKAALAVRTSGILYKQGYKPESETETLVKPELSGLPYARWAFKNAKSFASKHPEKLEKMKPFVDALLKSLPATAKAPEGKAEEVAISV